MTVACIIPAYNAEAFLTQAVESLQQQTYPLSEIIVVDDGSTDGTAALARRLAGQDPRLRLVQQANSGNTAARNLGVQQGQCQLLTFLDADDLWLPDRLEQGMRAFEEDSQLDYAVGYARAFFDWHPDTPEEVRVRSQLDPRNQGDHPAFIGAGLMVTRQAWDKVGPFDPERCHASGMDWFLRARALGLREALVPLACYLRRIHGHNVSLQAAANSQRQFAQALRDHIQRSRLRPSQDRPS